jgi:hypothetical protein
MLRHAPILCLFLTFLAAAACQTYSTGPVSGLVQSQDTLGETVVISTLQQVAKAQFAYSVSSGGSFGSFEQLTEGGYLDSRFASNRPEISGYALSMTTTLGSFSCNADPVSADNKNARHFYIDSTSPNVHVNATAPASANDPNVQ